MRPVERPEPKVIVQPWGTEEILDINGAFSLKRLDYRAGCAGGLQYHMTKIETFHIFSGVAVVGWDRGDGTWHEERAYAGATFRIPRGAPHQFRAITDCTVFEASEPAMGDRVNVAERYGKDVEPGTLPTTWTAEAIAAFEAGLTEEATVVSP